MISAAINSNYRRCLRVELLGTTFLGISFMAVYYQRHGLSQAEIYTLQSTIAVVGLFMDIPFGHLADRIGTRRMLVTGYICCVFGYGAFSVCQEFWQFELCVAFNSMCGAMLSGTMSALMIRSLGGWRAQKRIYRRYERHSLQVRALSALFGVFAGGAVASQFSMAMAYHLQPLIYGAAAITALGLVEPQRARDPEDVTDSVNDIRKVARKMLIENRAVRWLLLHGAVMDTMVLSVFWLIQVKLQMAGMPVWSFMLFYNGGAVASFAIAHFESRLKLSDQANFTMQLVVVAGFIMLAGCFTGVAGALFLFGALALGAALSTQLLRGALFELLPKAFANRTTEMSVSSAVQSLLFAVVSPLLGLLTDATSANVTLLVIGGLGLLCGGLTLYLLYGVELKK